MHNTDEFDYSFFLWAEVQSYEAAIGSVQKDGKLNNSDKKEKIDSINSKIDSLKQHLKQLEQCSGSIDSLERISLAIVGGNDITRKRNAIYVHNTLKHLFPLPYFKDFTYQFPVIDVLEEVWQQHAFPNGNIYLDKLLDSCNIDDKRCRDIARFFLLTYYITLAEEHEKTGDEKYSEHYEERKEIKARLNGIIISPQETPNNTLEDNGETPISQLVKDREKVLNAKQLTYITPQKKIKKRFTSNQRILIAAAWIHTGMYKDQRYGGGNDAIKAAIPVVDKLYGLNLLKESTVSGFSIKQGGKTILLPRNDTKRIEESLSDIRNSHQDYITKIIKISNSPAEVQADVDKVQS